MNHALCCFIHIGFRIVCCSGTIAAILTAVLQMCIRDRLILGMLMLGTTDAGTFNEKDFVTAEPTAVLPEYVCTLMLAEADVAFGI